MTANTHENITGPLWAHVSRTFPTSLPSADVIVTALTHYDRPSSGRADVAADVAANVRDAVRRLLRDAFAFSHLRTGHQDLDTLNAFGRVVRGTALAGCAAARRDYGRPHAFGAFASGRCRVCRNLDASPDVATWADALDLARWNIDALGQAAYHVDGLDVVPGSIADGLHAVHAVTAEATTYAVHNVSTAPRDASVLVLSAALIADGVASAVPFLTRH
jgi:hypothetical protein